MDFREEKLSYPILAKVDSFREEALQFTLHHQRVPQRSPTDNTYVFACNVKSLLGPEHDSANLNTPNG